MNKPIKIHIDECTSRIIELLQKNINVEYDSFLYHQLRFIVGDCMYKLYFNTVEAKDESSTFDGNGTNS